jgi:hypothetical protein
MPEIQRANLPPALLAHLLDRVAERNITKDDLMQILHWIEGNPIVPEGDWFKRFGHVTVCGNGALIKTFLNPEHVAIGKEVQ